MMKIMKIKLEEHPFFIEKTQEDEKVTYCFQEGYIIVLNKDEIDWKTNKLGVLMLNQADIWFIELYSGLYKEIIKKNRVKRLMEGRRVAINILSRHYYLLPFKIKHGTFPIGNVGMSGELITENGFITNEHELALGLFAALKEERYPVAFEEKEEGTYCIKIKKETN